MAGKTDMTTKTNGQVLSGEESYEGKEAGGLLTCLNFGEWLDVGREEGWRGRGA